MKSDFDPSSAFLIGRAFAFHNQAMLAIEVFKSVALKDKDMTLVSSREIANLYLSLDMPREALRFLKELVKKSPNDLLGVYNMGAALAQLGKVPNSAKWFRKAIELFQRPEARGKLPGETASLLQAMSQAYAETGDIGRAIALLNEALSKSRMVKTEIFSFLQYKNIPRQDFLLETRELLKRFMKRAPRSLGIHPA